MTKAELIASVMTAVGTENSELASAIKNIMNEYKGGSTKAKVVRDEHTNLIAEDGSISVWCNKHLKYEPAEEFATVQNSKTGYHNKCKIADLQWKDYLAQIKEVQSEIDSAIEAQTYEKLPALQAKKVDLTTLKDGEYKYPSKKELAKLLPTTKEV